MATPIEEFEDRSLDGWSMTLRRRVSENWADWLRVLLVPTAVVCIVGIAFLLRFTGQNWDAGQNLNPDEHTITAVAPQLSWPSTVFGYFDTDNSPLNPLNFIPSFIYGSFPLFLGKLLVHLTGDRGDSTWPIVYRTLSALFDLLTVLMLFVVGRRLFGRLVGLLAALLYALCVLPIQYSHFGTFDLAGPSLGLLAFFFCLRAIDHGRWRDFALLGAFAGLAIASKLSMLPVIVMAVFPLVEAARCAPAAPAWRARLRPLQPVILQTLASLLVGFLTVRFALPYAFAGPGPLGIHFDSRWHQDIDYWRSVQSGATDFYPSIQWSHRTPLLFALKNVVLWGMGPALGITALVGLAFALARVLTIRKLPPGWMLILVGWPLFFLIYIGLSFDQTMRYLLPAYPVLVLIAAAALGVSGEWLLQRYRHVWLALLPAVFVIALTALWAFAFTSIYTRPTTRVTASEWIYRNVPPGSTILIEHWDHRLPLDGVMTRGSGDFDIVTLPMYDPDNQDKADNIVAQLAGAEYIVLASNRIWESIPRLPERYPMSIAYYDALFDGRLGFEKVQTVTSYPRLLGLQINDSSAEEAFSVFDHPRIMIFRKSDAFDRKRVQNILNTALDTEIVATTSLEGGRNGAMMTDEQRRIQAAGGTWSDAWDRDSIANRFPAIFWYLAMQAMALLAIPLTWRALPGLPDRGYAAAKTVGLLAVATLSWLLPSYHLMEFGRGVVLVSMGIMGSISVAAAWPVRRTLLPDMRGKIHWAVAAEIIYLLAFLLFVEIRRQNPDIWHFLFSGEKPFEFAFFNAIAKSTYFPPYDPWYSGGIINYYYFGWVIFAAVSRLTGVIPSVSFNLALASISALIVLNAWSFTSAILAYFSGWLRPRSKWIPLLGGLIGSLFFAFTSNYDFVRRLGTRQWGELENVDPRITMRFLGAPGDIVLGTWRALNRDFEVPDGGFWRPSRVILHTINEFPAFSMVLADLHPHLMAMPVTLLALILALGFVAGRPWANAQRQPHSTEHAFFGIVGGWRSWIVYLRTVPISERFWAMLLAALVTGVLYPLNTWDYPTYVIVIGASVFIVDCLGSAVDPETAIRTGWKLWYSPIRRAGLTVVAMLAAGRLIFLPYFEHYLPHPTGFVPVTSTSPASGWVTIFALFAFLIVSYLLVDLWYSFPAVRISFWNSHRRMPGSLAAVSFAVASLLLALSAFHTTWIVPLLGSIMILILPALVIHRKDPRQLALLLMVALGIAISFFVERYALVGDNGRLNTVFKLHLEVWMLLSLASAAFVVLLVLAPSRAMPRWLKVPWLVVTAFLVIASLVFPGYAVEMRSRPYFRVGTHQPTLDGMAFMNGPQADEVDRQSEYKAVIWIQDHIPGSPVMLSAHTDGFQWSLVPSIFAGLPTIIGWDSVTHERQQRSFAIANIDQRVADVDTILGQSYPFEDIRPLLDKYHVEYIYIGPVERGKYDPDALKKFEIAADKGLLEIVYDQDDVAIYWYRPADASVD